MNYEILKTDIKNRQELVNYIEAKNDQAIADFYNSTVTTVISSVDVKTLQATMLQMIHSSGMPVWLIIEDTAVNTSANPAVRTACRMVLLTASARFDNIHLNLPVVASVLDGLVTATILTSEQRTALDILATKPVTYAEQVLGEKVTVTESDISFALRGDK